MRLLIDVRDIRECRRKYETQFTYLEECQFWLDPQSSYFQEKMSKVKNIVLFCALGFRSALATKALRDMGFKNVANAKGGFDALKNAGIEVVQKEKK